jgi:hypothetical protein
VIAEFVKLQTCNIILLLPCSCTVVEIKMYIL